MFPWWSDNLSVHDLWPAGCSMQPNLVWKTPRDQTLDLQWTVLKNNWNQLTVINSLMEDFRTNSLTYTEDNIHILWYQYFILAFICKILTVGHCQFTIFVYFLYSELITVKMLKGTVQIKLRPQKMGYIHEFAISLVIQKRV